MLRFATSDLWKATYPGAAVGILAMGQVANPERCAALDQRKALVEQELRTRFAGADRMVLKALPTIEAYTAYYKRFEKTYHVLLQLESVALKGKPIPTVAALVEAMFVAELKNQLLTAGHDADAIRPPVGIDVADGSEQYFQFSGREQRLTAGDMVIRDANGVLSTILHGPDQRTRITVHTHNVLFTVYAPAGISPDSVEAHLRDIRDNVLLVAPTAAVESLEVYRAD